MKIKVVSKASLILVRTARLDRGFMGSKRQTDDKPRITSFVLCSRRLIYTEASLGRQSLGHHAALLHYLHA